MKMNSFTSMVFATIAPTGIKLNPESLMSYVGRKDTIKTTFSTSNASGGITWSSGNPTIASVNQSGVVTGVAVGTAVITAKTGNNLTATCTVTITKWTTYPNNLSDVSAMVIDGGGNKWISTHGGGVWQWYPLDYIQYLQQQAGC
jgi:uncharacterized protein YjdB